MEQRAESEEKKKKILFPCAIHYAGVAMIKGIFITGTDTGVGKTYVAAGIAAHLKRIGVNVGVMKPVETGCGPRRGRLIPNDAVRLMKSASVRDALSLVNPYRFRKPLAPSVAAKLEGKEIVPDRIVRSYRMLSLRHDFMIVEGAGGIMVPLRHQYTYLDLACTIGLPVIIVARPSLGTINHTLLTITALRERGVEIAGIVINDAQGKRAGLVEKTSPSVIEELSGARILGIISYGSSKFDAIAEGFK